MSEIEVRASVSVVIPCYRCSDVLDRATASVFAQTLLPKELILVDDGSPDNGATRQRILEICNRAKSMDDLEVRPLLLDRNVGPGSARNAAWNVAQGDYLAFLDADDAWHSKKIEIQYAWMKEHPQCDLSSHNSVQMLHEAMAETPLLLELETQRSTLGSMLFKNDILTRTVMLKRSLTERFPDNGRFSEDYSLWMDMIAAGRWLEQLNVGLAYSFRPPFDAGGQSGRLWSMEAAELGIYWRLVRTAKIDWLTASAAAGFSVAKFVRRLATRVLR